MPFNVSRPVQQFRRIFHLVHRDSSAEWGEHPQVRQCAGMSPEAVSG